MYMNGTHQDTPHDSVGELSEQNLTVWCLLLEVIRDPRSFLVSSLRAMQLPLELYDVRHLFITHDYDWRRHNWAAWAHISD